VLAESIGKKGKVYIQDMIPGPDLSPRAQGCKEALAHYPDIELVGVDFNDGDTGKSEEQTTAVLEREKDLAGIFIINLSAVEGTGRAVEKAGKKGTVRLVAFDATAGNIENLKAGVLSIIIGQRPHDMGFLAVICAAANARGVDSFPKRVPTDFVIIDAGNVNDPDLAGLIY
jgi:ribose transport system substrate-binding protein